MGNITMISRTKLYKTYETYERRDAWKIDRAFLDFQKHDHNYQICPHCHTHKSGTDCPIIPAPFYVMSNDTFFSGWGMAKGMINTVVVPCASWHEAELVVQYIKGYRTDQQRIRIVIHKPRTNRYRLLSQIIDWRYHGLGIDPPIAKKRGQYVTIQQEKAE